MIFPHFRHIIINLWHGIPVKTISLAQPRYKGLQRKFLNPFYTRCDYLISSSDIDRLAMSASMMHNFNDVWVTGLPRNDYLSKSEVLPQDLQAEETALLDRLDGRKLLIYAPTFREWEDVSNPLSDPENLQELTQALREQGFVLGLRLHPMDSSLKIDGQGDMLDCGGDRFSNPQVVLRHTSCLVTDYSSIWTDFLLTGRPIVGFVYDYERYMAERAMLYDLEKVFPGQLNKTFDGFLQDVRAAMGRDQDRSDQYQFSRKLFFKYLDSRATQRVVDNARAQAGL
jgi:CDP-glycerol glycerophosphotransferase (TagB/SpsB family)